MVFCQVIYAKMYFHYKTSNSKWKYLLNILVWKKRMKQEHWSLSHQTPWSRTRPPLPFPPWQLLTGCLKLSHLLSCWTTLSLRRSLSPVNFYQLLDPSLPDSPTCYLLNFFLYTSDKPRYAMYHIKSHKAVRFKLWLGVTFFKLMFIL